MATCLITLVIVAQFETLCPFFQFLNGFLCCLMRIVITRKSQMIALEQYELCKVIWKLKYDSLNNVRHSGTHEWWFELVFILSKATLRKDTCTTRCILCSWLKNRASFGQNDFLCFSSVGLRRSSVSYIERKSLCVCLEVCQATHSAGSKVSQCHIEWAGQHNMVKNAVWAHPEKLRITMTTTGFLRDNKKENIPMWQLPRR